MKALLHTRLFSFRIGNHVFSPGVLTTLLAVILVYVMISMAQWQAGKAAYLENLRETIESRKDLPAVGMDELPPGIEDRLFLPVVLTGQYDSEHYFLLDNRVHNGEVGYDVYVPLRMAHGGALLVNRGFIAQGRSRQVLPKIDTPAGPVQLKGLLDRPPSKTVVLLDNVHQVIAWPMVLQYIDLDEIQKMLGHGMFDMILWLSADDPHSLVAHQPALILDGAKNSGYAFQWYAMSAALIIIYFLVNTKRRENNEPDE